MATDSVVLIQITPRSAIDSILNAYHTKPSSNFYVRFGLPFDIVSFAQLSGAALSFTSSPQLQQVQPTFKSSNIVGGD